MTPAEMQEKIAKIIDGPYAMDKAAEIMALVQPAPVQVDREALMRCTRDDMERFPCYECYRDNDFDVEPNPGCAVCGGTGIVRVDVGGEGDE